VGGPVAAGHGGGMKSNLEHFSGWQYFSESLRILNYSKDSRKTDLNELWSNRQEVLHGDLQ
jgi:hypothetical protein